MKHAIMFSLIGIAILTFALPTGIAKPKASADSDYVPFGNGFPSGPHFNLNIIGKKDNFTCPDPIDPDTGEYGNVIFIPRDPGFDDITILMESGKKGPRGATGTQYLEVTDCCSESFDGDAGVLRLPANANGYAVYARLTGKPGGHGSGEPTATFSPGLAYVMDGSGNDLLLLGLVDRDGTATFASDGETIYRTSTDPAVKGKGVQKATNITNLFLWSGTICYLPDEYGEYPYCDGVSCDPLELCCVDADNDGIYEACEALVLDDDGISYVCPISDPNELVTAMCKEYYSPEWVFNISDFVGYLWDIDNNGSYVIQVRFYPL